MKTAYIVAGLVTLLWVKGRKTKDAKNQIAETASSQRGSDWIGAGGLYAMWDRLSGADLHAPGYSNIAAGPVADPGKMGALSAGILPGWDGGI
jgi:hypothetical protein